MNNDRTAIYQIVSSMLDDDAYDALEKYVEAQRAKALGWAHAYACDKLDKGLDLRTVEVPIMIEQAMKDLIKG